MQMFRAVYVSWIVLAGAGIARADEAAPVAAPAPPIASLGSSIAIGTNLPMMWTHGFSVAGSLSVSLSARHALRVNVASYAYDNELNEVLSGLAGGDDYVARDGRTTDVSLSWVFYPRWMWDGFLVELGVLRRSIDVTMRDDEDLGSAALPVTEWKATEYAGRAMIGWSWRLDRHFFIATAVGLSNGWQSGTEEERSTNGRQRMATPIARDAGSLEGYLRFGGIIDL